MKEFFRRILKNIFRKKSKDVLLTKEIINLAVSLKACPEGIERAKRGFKFLTREDKAWIAQQKETPVFLLEVLSTDEYCRVRYRIASNPSTPASLLEKLSADEGSFVRENVAKNPSIPVSLLEKFAADEDIFVRFRVARNPSTPVTILEKLSTDENFLVRAEVAKNPIWIASKK